MTNPTHLQRRFLAAVLALLPCLTLAQAPPASPAWFGLPLPATSDDPHRPVIDVARVALKPAAVPADEKGFADLNGAPIRKDLATIVDFAKESRAQGNRMWGRISGFPSAVATMDWVAAQFRAAGLRDVDVQRFPAGAPMWWSSSWDVRLTGSNAFGAGTHDIVFQSALPTSGSAIVGGTVTAPLVHVGDTTSPLPGDVDVSGRIAVQHLDPASGAYSERTRTVERARALAGKGAVAVLNVIEQPGNMRVHDFGNCGLPCFNLGGADGAFLEAVMTRAAAAGKIADLRMRLTLQSEMRTGLSAQNVMGVIEGKRTDENVIVNAHGDSWFDGAGDNGDGLAVLVALARHFARPEHKPDRTLVFVASAGHHGQGLNGPANFVRMNPQTTAKTVLVLNLEHIAQLSFRTDPWRVEATEQPMGFGISNDAAFIADVARRGMARYGFNLRPDFSSSVPGDLGGYASLGAPRVQAIHSGPMYHTSGDVLDTISEPGLERAARFFRFFVDEVARADRADLQPAR